MRKYIIEGGQPLNGYVEISGAKNAALPVLSATLLVPGISVLNNVPDLTDVSKTIEILKCLGCKVEREKKVVMVDATNITTTNIDEKFASEIRSSVTLIGALLGRCGNVSISYPGDYVIKLTENKWIKKKICSTIILLDDYLKRMRCNL